ncbi:MAG: energy transducer TonB [Microcoleaceae cyanobacterium]
MRWKPIAIVTLLSLCTLALRAQDTTTTYYKSAEKFKVVPKWKAGAKIIQVYENNSLLERKIVSLPDNKVRQQEYYEGNRPLGTWQYWDGEGRLLRKRDFAKVIYKDYNQNPDSTMAQLRAFLDAGGVLAKFRSGEQEFLRWLSQSIEYPIETIRKKSQGILYITFVVDENGNASPSFIHNGGFVGYCDLVVWETIEKMPRWTPAIEKGENVSIEYILPVQFDLR